MAEAIANKDLEVRIKCQGVVRRKCFVEHRYGTTRVLTVSLPHKKIGLNTKFKMQNNTTTELRTCKSNSQNSYILVIEKRIEDKMTLQIHLRCDVRDDNTCHATINICKVNTKQNIQLTTDKISTSRKSILCNGSLTLESNQTIHLQSVVICPILTFRSSTGDIRLSSEASVCTHFLTTSGRKTYIEGRVSYCQAFTTKSEQKSKISESTKTKNDSNRELTERKILIRIYGNLHIARDGRIGTRERSDKTKNTLVEKVMLTVKGDIINFGEILASKTIVIDGNNILSCQSCDDDTSHLYYKIIEKKLCGEISNNSIPQTADFHSAVTNRNHLDTAKLLRLGKNPNTRSNKHRMTPSRKAEYDLKATFKTPRSTSNKCCVDKEKIDRVASLIRASNKRYGSFAAPNIKCRLTGNLENLSQLKGFDVQLDVNGSVTVGKHSSVIIGSLSGKCDNIFNIEGDAIIGNFQFFEAQSFCVVENGYLVIKDGGDIIAARIFKINCVILNCNGLLNIKAGIFMQSEDGKLCSGGALRITIKQDSDKIEGEITSNSLYFEVGAQVVENCCMKSESSITIEVQENINFEKIIVFVTKGQ